MKLKCIAKAIDQPRRSRHELIDKRPFDAPWALQFYLHLLIRIFVSKIPQHYLRLLNTLFHLSHIITLSGRSPTIPPASCNLIILDRCLGPEILPFVFPKFSSSLDHFQRNIRRKQKFAAHSPIFQKEWQRQHPITINSTSP